MQYVLAALGLIAGPFLTSQVLKNLRRKRLGRERLFQQVDETPVERDAEADFLTRWLSRAGYRDSGAASAFLGLTALAIVVALTVPYVVYASGVTAQMVRGLEVIPGAVGEIFLPFVYIAPWALATGLACMPWLVVRAARRRRVRDIEQDLPIYLELFATLSEAGLGFDAALDRVLRAQASDMPLANEFRTFQVEVLAGRRRTDCLRRLARRVDVLTLTIFVSAMVQAEQVGSGVAAVLRRQADDLRERRRESLLAQAMTLPVKLVFPLVICFLPGIFAVTLGPIFYQFFQLAESLMRGRGAGP
jgi:tight adherence protein C